MTPPDNSLELVCHTNSGLGIYRFETEVGWAAFQFQLLTDSESQLQRLTFGYPSPTALADNTSWLQEAIQECQRTESIPKHSRSQLEAWASLIQEFCLGHPVPLEQIPIDLGHLSPFGKAVSQACQRVGWGDTASYKQLATAAGNPQAARAAGMVMKRNRFPLIVPCHRIMATNGKLTGFSAPGGLATKRLVLSQERLTPLGF